jgi:nucleoside-diphosphate-sugar epimerase
MSNTKPRVLITGATGQIGRQVVAKLAGDPDLGMIDRLRDLASAQSDDVGLALEEERLPKRIEIRPRRTSKANVEK